MTTNVPGGQQQHSHYDSLAAAVDRCRRRKIDLDTLVSFYFTPFSHLLSLIDSPFFASEILPTQRALHTVAKTITSSPLATPPAFSSSSVSGSATFPSGTTLSHGMLYSDIRKLTDGGSKSSEMKATGSIRRAHRETESLGVVCVGV